MIEQWEMPELSGIRDAGYDKAKTEIEVFTGQKYVTVTGDVYGTMLAVADYDGFFTELPKKKPKAKLPCDAQITKIDLSDTEKFKLLFDGKWEEVKKEKVNGLQIRLVQPTAVKAKPIAAFARYWHTSTVTTRMPSMRSLEKADCTGTNGSVTTTAKIRYRKALSSPRVTRIAKEILRNFARRTREMPNGWSHCMARISDTCTTSKSGYTGTARVESRPDCGNSPGCEGDCSRHAHGCKQHPGRCHAPEIRGLGRQIGIQRVAGEYGCVGPERTGVLRA